MSTQPLDAEAVAAVDSTGQAAEIVALPAHLRDALGRVDSAGLAPVDAPGGLVVTGMGGSAVGGRLAQAALGSRLTRPFVVADGYTPGSLVAEARVFEALTARYLGGFTIDARSSLSVAVPKSQSGQGRVTEDFQRRVRDALAFRARGVDPPIL